MRQRRSATGGIVIVLFVIYHLMHFTLGTPGVHSDFVAGNAYHNVISGFQSPIIGCGLSAGIGPRWECISTTVSGA